MANRLANENSPYLLQHANNPVDWYPWGEEALQKAKNEDKLLLISIGYSACHWCHVMEKESFEDASTAQLMNAHFVCIKVDREERADVDQVYMEAVQLMTGRGGWPLNCFALPDGRPIYGGTYFPPQQWQNVLQALANGYRTERKKFLDYAEKLTAGIQDGLLPDSSNETLAFEEIYRQSVERIKRTFDTDFGGFKGAPKFPLPGALDFLYESAFFFQDRALSNFVALSLTKMAHSGLYDVLGGGFARYSVDAYWKVPHFEKMLYDNAQLISVYAKAYQHTQNPLFKKVVEESLNYVKRELTNDYGGFYSAQDADSEGEEGKFYVWTTDEIDSLLGDDAAFAKEYFQLENEGNWEEKKNILYPFEKQEEIRLKYALTEDSFQEKLRHSKQTLFSYRQTRVFPGLDDKSITAWNALMLSAYIDAYKALQNQHYLESAQKAAQFILRLVDEEGKMLRIFKNGKQKIDAFLDDYAYVIRAFISIYQVTFEKLYLDFALKLTEYVVAHFSDKKTPLFFYTSNLSAGLVARKKELTDSVTPASNSVMAHNLHLLGVLTDQALYLERAKQMLAQLQNQIEKGGAYYSNWLRLMHRFIKPGSEVVIMGPDCVTKALELQKEYAPQLVFAGSKDKAYLPLMEMREQVKETFIYVCKGNTCQLPTQSVKEAKKQFGL